jgi:hypothetical protein
MKNLVIFAAIGAFIYLLYESLKKKTVAPIVITPSTPMATGILSFFASPSPIIQNGPLSTPGVNSRFVGPTYAQAGIQPDLPLTPPSPSLLTPLEGSPAVNSSSDINPGVDYPGLQTYMVNPDAPDPNSNFVNGAFFS